MTDTDVKTLDQKKEEFIKLLDTFDNTIYKLSEAWEDRELADLIHGNTRIMEVVKEVFPMSVDEWWHVIAELREVVKKEFHPRLTTRQLREKLYHLLPQDQPVLVYTNGWYYYIKDLSPKLDEEGALPVVEIGEAFDTRDL